MKKKQNPPKLEVHRETLLLLLERKHLALAGGGDGTGIDTGSAGGPCHSKVCDY